MSGLEIVLEYLPPTIRCKIEPALNAQECKIEPALNAQIEEIRLRSNKPLMLKIGQETQIIDYIVKQQEVFQAFERICENSVYSYTRQICDGYITIRGGNRVGIVGSAVVSNGQVININYISSLNFRIARQKIGCSNSIIKNIIDETNDSIYNTLIVSPPGCGKTTLLRDIVRNISNGISEIGFKGKTVGVVDERGEIAAMYKGIPQNDIGIRTDVIDNIPKAIGMKMLIRSMSPKGIFTAHGKNIDEINQDEDFSKLLNKHVFERIILLNPEKRGDARCIYL